jgi:Contractile injection system tube protein
MELQKAIIAELDGENVKDSFPVQFNPTTLRLTLNNRVEGGESHGRQVRQFIGPSSASLSLDLIFDTADDGSTTRPRSVRVKTKQLERFLFPKGAGKQGNTPPRIRFVWGDLIVDGVADSLTIDFDHFAANGAPLRAKVSLTIKGQDSEKDLKPIKGNRKAAPTPGRASAGGVGSGAGGGAGGGGLGGGVGPSAQASAGFGASAGISLGASASVGVALDGESAADFAARVGIDPAAWRGLDLGGESSLSLSAGVEIGFDAELNASAGLGVTVGVESGVSASLEASVGLEASASLSAVAGIGVGAELASGFALSAAGGVSAAIESVQNTRNQSAEQKAREAFDAPQKTLPPAAAPTIQRARATSGVSSAASRQPAPPDQARAPLKNTGLPSPATQQAAAHRPARADVRASSFGFGVPLRQTVGEAANLRADSIQGGVAIKSKIASGEPPMTTDPTKPHWVALPARDRARKSADKVQQRTRPARPCGCAGRCKH